MTDVIAHTSLPAPAAWVDAVGRARARLAAGRPEQAAAILAAVIRHDPDNFEAAILLSASLRSCGDLAGAQAVLGRLEPRHGRSPALLAQKALCARATGDHEGAFACFREAVRLKPGHPDLELELARCEVAQQDLDPAIARLRGVVDRNPHHAGARALLVNALRANGDLADAVTILDGAGPTEVLPAALILAKGLLERARSEFDASLAALDHGADRFPDQPQFALEAIRTLVAADRVPDAVRRVVALAGRRSADVETCLACAGILADLEHDQASDAILDRCAREAHAAPDFLHHRGRNALSRGEHQAALTFFREGRARHPDHVPLVVACAAQELAAGDADAALATIADAQRRNPRSYEFNLEAGRLARTARRSAEAFRYFIAARDARPWRHEAPAEIAATLSAAGLPADALRYLRRLPASMRARPSLALQRAKALAVLGRMDAAIAVLCRRPLATSGRDFALRRQLATFHADIGSFRAATALVEGHAPRSRFERECIALLRGRIAADTWDLAAARRHFAEISRTPVLVYVASDALARLAIQQLQLDEARDFLRRALRHERYRFDLIVRSQKLSQNYLGQIVNELALDGETTSRAAQIMGSTGGAARIPAMLALAFGAPDSLAVGLGLAVLMRTEGRFAAVARAGSEHGGDLRIPKLIHQYWSGPRIPPEVQLFMSGWRRRHPDFVHRVYDHGLAVNFLREHGLHAALDAYLSARYAAQKSDIFRLACLDAVGGVYVDADDACRGHLGAVIPADAEFVGYQENVGSIANNFLAATPGNSVIAHGLAQAVEAVLRGDAETPWLSTGPGLITRAFVAVGLDATAGAPRQGHYVFTAAELARVTLMNRNVSYKQDARHWINAQFAPNTARAPAAPPDIDVLAG